MKQRIALAVGINDYPGTSNDLHGCVNDANDWSALLDSEGYSVATMLDSDATRANVATTLRSAVAALRWGDRLVFTYSGHGSTLPDRDGDESDSKDEALVLYDWQNAGYLVDDEIASILAEREFGTRVIIISDSCFSGTVARFVGPTSKPRYFNAELLPERPITRALRRKPNDSVLLSGCAENEVSYDATIQGVPRGAFSWAALSTYVPGQSISAWHNATRLVLPNDDYPQSPQLQATAWQRRWHLS